MKKFYFVGTSPYKFRSSTPPPGPLCQTYTCHKYVVIPLVFVSASFDSELVVTKSKKFGDKLPEFELREV